MRNHTSQSMSTHEPEGWVVIKLLRGTPEEHYRVFGTWRGGYLDGDAWRLSSGAESLETMEHYADCIEYPQDSGSLYVLCDGGQGGTTMYTQDILSKILEDSNGEVVDI